MPGRSTRACACLLVAVAMTPPVSVAQQRISSRSVTVDAAVDVEVYNVAGSVRITGWDRNEVQVEGTLGDGAERLTFENDGGGVEIRVIVPPGRRRDPERQVGATHLEIMVPRGASVSIETLAATITVLDVDGAVSMESSSGSVTYSGGAVEIEAGSAAGDIEISASAAGASIEVGGVAGSVMVQFIDARVHASTLTGSLRVIGGRLRDGDFESVSGSLYFEGEIASGAELDFENFDGSIDLLIPAASAASFEITTFSGSIETEFGFEGRSVEAYTPEQEVEFTLGDGGDNAAVSIETFSGTVRVRRR